MILLKERKVNKSKTTRYISKMQSAEKNGAEPLLLYVANKYAIANVVTLNPKKMQKSQIEQIIQLKLAGWPISLQKHALNDIAAEPIESSNNPAKSSQYGLFFVVFFGFIFKKYQSTCCQPDVKQPSTLQVAEIVISNKNTLNAVRHYHFLLASTEKKRSLQWNKDCQLRYECPWK